MTAIESLLSYLTNNAALLTNNDAREIVNLEDFIRKLEKDEDLQKFLCLNGFTKSFEGGVEFDELFQALMNFQLNNSPKYAGRILSCDEEKLLVFTPRILMSCIDQSSNGLFTRVHPFINSSTLLVEIMGVDTIASPLVSKDSSAIESLYGSVHDFISCITGAVLQHGGDVISIDGVTILCVFSQERNSDDQILSCVRAFECGLELRDLVSGALGTRVAVCHGEVSLSVAGGQDDNWVCVLHGACVVELFACLSQAADHEMISTPECCRRVTDRLETLREDEKHNISLKQSFELLLNWVSAPTGSAKVLSMHVPTAAHTLVGNTGLSSTAPVYAKGCVESSKLFIPTPLLAALCGDALDQLTGLRTVTTLSAMISPSTSRRSRGGTQNTQEHTDEELVQSMITTIQQILMTSGGFLKSFHKGQHGWVLVIMWGLPFATFINNCARSMFCALSIKQHTELMHWKCSIGITTGPAITGLMGCADRQDYVVFGQDIQISKQLMMLGSESILLSASSHQHLSSRMRQKFQSLDVGALGKLNVYEYRTNGAEFDPSMMNEFNSKFVSSILPNHIATQLLSQLDKILNSVTTDCVMMKSRSGVFLRSPSSSSMTSSKDGSEAGLVEPAVTAIVGGAGIGKTTAIAFVLQRAKRMMLNCIHICCVPSEQGKPFSLIRKILMEIIGPMKFQTHTTLKSVIDKLLADIELQDRSKNNGHAVERRAKRFKALRSFLNIGWQDVKTTTAVSITAPISNTMIPDDAIVEHNDKTFAEVLGVLLRHTRTVIAIDDGHFCDDLSWKQLHNLVTGATVPMAIFIASRVGVNGSMLRHSMLPRGFLVSKFSQQSFGQESQKSSQYCSSRASAHYCPSEAYDGVFGKNDAEMLSNSSYLALLRLDVCLIVELELLTVLEVTEVLHRVMGDSAVISAQLAKSVHGFSGGNPYWCNAIAHFVHQHGEEAFSAAVSGESSDTASAAASAAAASAAAGGGGAGIDNSSGLHSLAALITARFDMLSFSVQSIAKVASVIGEHFTVKQLKVLTSFSDNEDLQDNLDILRTANFITLLDSTTLTFSFQNSTIRTTVYGLIAPKQVGVLHFNIATNMEEENSDDYPTMSYHFRLSGCGRYQALKYAVKAGKRCLRLGAFMEALAFLKTALPLAVTRPELRAILLITEQGMTLMQPPAPAVTIGGLLRRLSVGRAAVDTTTLKLHSQYKHLHDDINHTLVYMTAGSEVATARDSHTNSNSNSGSQGHNNSDNHSRDSGGGGSGSDEGGGGGGGTHFEKDNEVICDVIGQLTKELSSVDISGAPKAAPSRACIIA